MLSVQEWLNNLADSDSSTEKDSTMLQNMLRRFQTVWQKEQLKKN